ncbi:MAG: hypothetical protein IKG04_02895 [Exiguobacterium sp.]|nr:hypothetical protein [Exiguobacterium sp.]
MAANDLQYLLGNRELLKSSDSINWLFPYVKNHVTLKPKNILENIQRKTSGTPNMLESASKTSHINQFLGQGYFGSNRVCDFNEEENQTYKDIFNYKPELKKEYVEILGDMCDLCREHDVDLVVIIPPLARFNAFDYGESWFLLTDQIRSVVESGGATFYDCNMLRTDYFSFDDSFYYNTQHLNVTGAKAFTKTLCQILQERQSDGDTQQFFYSPDEYRQSFDNVAFVRLTRKNSSGTNELTAQALVSPGIDVEYQFLVKKEGPSDDNWTVLRDYGPDSKCSFTPSEKGTYIIRVNTRTEGSNEDFQHYRTLKITR